MLVLVKHAPLSGHVSVYMHVSVYIHLSGHFAIMTPVTLPLCTRTVFSVCTRTIFSATLALSPVSLGLFRYLSGICLEPVTSRLSRVKHVAVGLPPVTCNCVTLP